ncbi:peptidoglycan-binding protein [Streptomyces sp. NPDC059851]|uniref:peptidoglycan-binding domain-containing protein n=1 Tax=Streptomyces sp. NPDC059851 TaxID=3346971 RepID=UPI003654970F
MKKIRTTATRTLATIAAAVATATVLGAGPAHAAVDDGRLFYCVQEVGTSYYGDVSIPDVMLSYGSTGICVEELQSDLLAVGVVPAADRPGFIDGDFGPKTRTAVMEFQRRANVAGGADGIVGPHTWYRLLNAAYFE